jgi:DNA-binding protein HU-beta
VRTVWDREAASSNLAAPTNQAGSIKPFAREAAFPIFSGKTFDRKFFLFTQPWRLTKIMARLTQTQIIAALSEASGLKKTEVKGLMDTLADMAIKEVKKNGEFTVPGFGKLKKTNRKAREGRNPATGAVIKIPAKTTVKFSLGKAMKDSIGGK